MTFKEFKTYCLSFHATSEVLPYDENENLVAYKIMDKVFAITNPVKFEYLNLKCDAVKAAMLRNLYDDVQPSDYYDERSWNVIHLDGILDDAIVKEWIRDSYELVFEDLPRKKQRVIEAMEEEE